MNLYCMSISTKDKIHFLWIFPNGKSRFCYVSFQKSTRKYTGGVIYSNYHGLFVVFLVASPADWIFARILQFFITACYGGHAPKFPTGNLRTAFTLQAHLKCCNDAKQAGCWLLGGAGTKARAWHKDGYIAGVNATIELTCSLTSQSSYTLPIFCCDSQSHKLTLLQSNTIKVIWNPPFWHMW